MRYGSLSLALSKFMEDSGHPPFAFFREYVDLRRSELSDCFTEGTPMNVLLVTRARSDGLFAYTVNGFSRGTFMERFCEVTVNISPETFGTTPSTGVIPDGADCEKHDVTTSRPRAKTTNEKLFNIFLSLISKRHSPASYSCAGYRTLDRMRNMKAGIQKVPERGQDARDRPLEVATHLFAARGFDGVSTREPVRRASVTLPSIAHYFRDAESFSWPLPSTGQSRMAFSPTQQPRRFQKLK
jgi:hypothetical protein